MEIGILIFFCIRNYFKARAAQLNAALWSFYTFLACMITWAIGGVIMSIIMISRDPQLKDILLRQPADRQAVVNHLTQKNLLVPQLFLIVCMAGGYLFIRHLLSKRLQS